MKILSKKQLDQLDTVTIKKENITIIDLMERAGKAIFELINERLKGSPVPIHVFCGLGNNGGDGLVVARYLVESGYNVTTYIVNFSNNRSEGFLKNFDRLKAIVTPWPNQIKSEKDFPKIPSTEQCFKIAVDVPSGVLSDQRPEDKNAVIYANSCLTFQVPKLVFFLPETAGYVQDLEILDIGLDKEFIHQIQSGIDLIGKQEVLPLYIPREKFGHKGTYGHSLLVGGSKGKIGSMVLASKACMRIGSGLTTAVIPECGYEVLQTSVPEVMVHENDSDDYIENFGALGEHPKELERLIGSWKDDFDKIEKTKAFSNTNKCIVLIKGAHSIVVYGGQLFVNNTGNPGMATAGSGDVLTGMLTGLLAQGYAPINAVIFGVYLHGRAGDLALQEFGYQALLASDIIEYIGKAYMDLFAQPEQITPQSEG